MKKITTFTLCALFLTGIQLSGAELTGRQIAEKVDAANKSETGIITKGTIILKDDKTGKTEKRNSIVLAKTVSNNGKSIFRFTSGSQKGTTFLSEERNGKENLQYVYLKSVGKARQVESSDKEKNFVDTDLSYESMGGLKIDDYNYKRLPDATFKGRDCYVIENLPKRSNSKYSKHIVYTDKEYLIPVATKSYNKAGRLVKQLMANPATIKTLRKGLYVPTEIIVKDLEEKHSTIVKAILVKETAFPNSVFNKNQLDSKLPME
ncbi:MAG TPA: outer membrane lipoprotein-sorting protein [Spirochaetota bacterium]|nr:outer membrane lipoprotein-sorting protein [Spirochaetota bacterium]